MKVYYSPEYDKVILARYVKCRGGYWRMVYEASETCQYGFISRVTLNGSEMKEFRKVYKLIGDL